MILITGATGFLGEFVARRLAHDGHPLAAFVRPTSDTSTLTALGVELRTGDLSDLPSLISALHNIEILVNVASLGFGHAPNIVRAAQEAGVRRAVFVSTTAIFTRLPAPTVPMRLDAERLIGASGLNYTIVRPTMIYGTPRDRNIWRLIQCLRRSPIMPVVGSGRGWQQPVFVADVAEAIARILETDKTIGREYNLPGAQPLTFVELIDTVAQVLEKRVCKVFLPLWLGLTGAWLTRRLPFGPRITPEQILRLEEDKAYDYRPAQQDFGYAPLTFAEGVRREIEFLSRVR